MPGQFPTAYRRGSQPAGPRTSPRPVVPRRIPVRLPTPRRPPVPSWRPVPRVPAGVPRAAANVWRASRLFSPVTLVPLWWWWLNEAYNNPNNAPGGGLSPALNSGWTLRNPQCGTPDFTKWGRTNATGSGWGSCTILPLSHGSNNMWVISRRSLSPTQDELAFDVFQPSPFTYDEGTQIYTGRKARWYSQIVTKAAPTPASPFTPQLTGVLLSPDLVLYDPYNPMTLPPGAWGQPLPRAPVLFRPPYPPNEVMPPLERPEVGPPPVRPPPKPQGDGEGPEGPKRRPLPIPWLWPPDTLPERWERILPDFEWVPDSFWAQPLYPGQRALPDNFYRYPTRPGPRVRPRELPLYPPVRGGTWRPVVGRTRVLVPEFALEPEPLPQPRPSTTLRTPVTQRVRERKVRATTKALRFIMGAGYFGTEVMDWVDVLHRQLPRQYRSKRGGFAGRVRAVWEHWRHLDPADAIRALVFNELQDLVIGSLIGRAQTWATERGVFLGGSRSPFMGPSNEQEQFLSENE